MHGSRADERSEVRRMRRDTERAEGNRGVGTQRKRGDVYGGRDLRAVRNRDGREERACV